MATSVDNGSPSTTVSLQKPSAPNWIDHGSIASWSLQQTSGDFLDDGDNWWDVPRASGVVYNHHTLFSKLSPQFVGTFGSASYPDARITSAISIGMIFRYTSNAESGIWCYSTGPTDALWGLQITSNGIFQVRDKRHPSAAGAAVSVYGVLDGPHMVVFGTRASDGSWKLIVDGVVYRTAGAAAAPAIVGDEVIAIGGRNNFDHIGLWDRELSLAETQELTLLVKPHLTF